MMPRHRWVGQLNSFKSNQTTATTTTVTIWIMCEPDIQIVCLLPGPNFPYFKRYFKVQTIKHVISKRTYKMTLGQFHKLNCTPHQTICAVYEIYPGLRVLNVCLYKVQHLCQSLLSNLPEMCQHLHFSWNWLIYKFW